MELKNLLEVSKINDKTVKEFEDIKKYIATGDVQDNKIVNYEEVRFASRPSRANREVEVGDILVARMKETVKVLKITEENYDEYIFSTGFCTLKSNNGVLDSDYFYKILISDYFQEQKDKNSKGATQKAINNTGLKKIKIPVPPINIQKQIVEVLDEAQNLINNRKEQIKLLNNLIESIFYDMFGDPVNNNRGWGEKKLGKLGKLDRGKSKHRPRNHISLYGGKYPFIQTGDVSNAGIYLDSFESTYSEKGLQQSKIWPEDTLCITIAANIAKTSILKIEACFPDSIVGFISNKYSNVIYIRTWFLFFQEIIEKAAPKSAQRNINLRILNDLDVIVPPITLQKQFAEKVELIEVQKQLLEDSLKLLEDNYNGLIQMAFKGELFK